MTDRDIELRLIQANKRIEGCEESIAYFHNFRKWYKPLNYLVYTKKEIKDWISKYQYLLEINIKSQEFYLKKRAENGDI